MSGTEVKEAVELKPAKAECWANRFYCSEWETGERGEVIHNIGCKSREAAERVAAKCLADHDAYIREHNLDWNAVFYLGPVLLTENAANLENNQ